MQNPREEEDHSEPQSLRSLCDLHHCLKALYNIFICHCFQSSSERNQNQRESEEPKARENHDFGSQ